MLIVETIARTRREHFIKEEDGVMGSLWKRGELAESDWTSLW
jgi:hypothetical protein